MLQGCYKVTAEWSSDPDLALLSWAAPAGWTSHVDRACLRALVPESYWNKLGLNAKNECSSRGHVPKYEVIVYSFLYTTHTHTHMHKHAYTPHTNACAHIHTNMCTHTSHTTYTPHTYTHVHTYIYIHTTYTHHIQMCTYTYTHAHTYTQHMYTHHTHIHTNLYRHTTNTPTHTVFAATFLFAFMILLPPSYLILKIPTIKREHFIS